MQFLYHLSKLKTNILYHRSIKMPPTKANGNIVKTVLSFIWKSILSFVNIPDVLAEYFFGKRMSLEVQSCNNNEQKNGNSGLTDDDEAALRYSWNILWTSQNKATKTAHGIQFFIVFFTNHPEALEYFPQFKDVTNLETLKTNPKMKAHALNVMRAIDSYIDNLDDKEVLVNLVTNMLRTHQKRDVGPKQLTWLVDVMHDILDLVLREKSTDSLKQSWTKFFGVVLDIAKTVT